MRTTKWVSLLLCSVVIVVASSRSGAQGLPVDGPTNQASWSFTGTVNSDQGSVPFFQTNLALSWLGDGQAVLLEGSNGVSGLCYAILDGSQTNVGTGTATVSLWAAPASWASTNVAGGAGVGQVAPLFEAGGCISGTSGGGFGLFLDGSGCWLSLKARGSDGSETTCFTAPVSFSTNVFKCVVVVVSPTNSVLYVDGLFATNGSGATGSQDWPVAVTNGFWLGSGPDGVQSRCMIDDVFTFGYALSSAEAQWLYDTYYWCYYLNPENPANTSLLTSAPYYTTNVGSDFRAMVGPGYLSCIGSDPNWSASDGVWMTNLSAQAGSGGATVLSFTVAGGTTNDGAVYDVLATGALASPATNCQFVWLGQVAAGQRYSAGIGSERAFLLLGTPYATNGSGLTWAQEWLLYHMDPAAGGDQNGNGIPDGWELAYFGDLNQTGGGDFDDDGVNNYTEWFYGTDPNKVKFNLSVTNEFVSGRFVPLRVGILGGVPSKMAVVVDDGPATWVAYSTNVVADLGVSEGWHDVRLGLRGRPENSYQSFQHVRVKLDMTPPLLVLTNPVSGTVDQPMVQLQGWCPEALSDLYFDLTNAAGVFSNQQVLVTGDCYDTNTWEFGGCTWQAYDVGIAVGQNVFTIYATDLAGNVTVTNFTFTLDYSGKTNPPTISLYWPQDGATLSGDSFAWRGNVSDYTAMVTAQVTDSSGVTNTYPALVERNGNFYVENVALSDTNGATVLTLFVLDAAGNSNSASVCVLKSPVVLALASVEADQLYKMRLNLSGLGGADGYSVWVNGVAAADNGNGTWSAQDVPVPEGGVAVFQVRAIPSDSTNSTSGGGSWCSLENLGNPADPGAIDMEFETNKPARLYVDEYILSWDREIGQQGEEYWGFERYSGHWKDGVGGTESDTWGDYAAGWVAQETWDWQAAHLPDTVSGTNTLWFDGVCEGTEETLGQLSLPQRHRQTQYTATNAWGFESYTHNEEAVVRFDAGGKGLPGETQLWSLHVGATAQLSSKPDADEPNPPAVVIPPEHLTVGAFGHPDTNGYVLLGLPLGMGMGGGGSTKAPSVTVSSPGTNRSIAQSTNQAHAIVTLTVVSNLANRARRTVGVGEGVDISFNPGVPATVDWGRRWGTVSPPYGTNARYTAPGGGVTDTVTASVGRRPVQTVSFNVIEPTGIQRTMVLATNNFQTLGVSNAPQLAVGDAGAEMLVGIIMAPTNVSFYNVEMHEVALDATSVTGYFANTNLFTTNPAHYLRHNSAMYNWFTLGTNNSWIDQCWLGSDSVPPPWSPGSFTWNIPWAWRAKSAMSVRDMTNGWQQIFTVNTNGTVSIQKFGGNSVQRGTNGVIIVTNPP